MSFDKGAACLGNDARDTRPRRSGEESVLSPGTLGSLVDDRPCTTCRDKDVRRTSRGCSRDRTRDNSTIWTRSPQRSCSRCNDRPVRGELPLENDHVRGIDGHDFDLVARQRGFELRQLGDAERTFRDARQQMKVSGFSFLDGASLAQMFVIVVLGSAVSPGLNGDDGMGAAQGILVFDLDDGTFDDASDGRQGRFVAFAIATTGTRGADEGRFQVEGVVGGEGLV